MKWLEGWFGTMSGGLGAVIVALVALLTPAYTQSQSCMTSNGVTTCYSAYGPGMPPPPTSGPQPGALILILITLLLFISVLIGTWLDLGGKRTIGRLILIIGASLLFLAYLFDGPVMSMFMGPYRSDMAQGIGVAFTFILPLTLLAFVAGVLACVRHDAPKPVAAPAQTSVSE